MTTDITELAQSMKAAAINVKETAHIARYSKATIARQTFKELMTSGNVLALLEALEKAQSTIAELEDKYENRTPTEWAYNQVCKALQSHKDLIAELELRAVKLPGWFVKDAIAVYDRDEVEEALTAAGIKWEAE